MRIVFIGASKFGLRCLEAMLPLPFSNIVGAVTVPQTFSISYRPQGVTNVLYADVKSFCDSKGISCLVMKQGMKDSGLLEQVQAFSPEIFIVSGWYHIIPKSWLDIAPAYGLHASLLPNYSGSAPLVWAMINGEKKTGITLFKFADRVDSGPIIGQKTTNINFDDTIATLYDRIESLGVQLLTEHLPLLNEGSAIHIPQDDSRRRIFPPRSPEDGSIDWLLSSEQIYNFIRAQTKPYPGAFALHGENKITIWRSRIADDPSMQHILPAEIKMVDNRIFVGCGDGLALEIIEVAKNGLNSTAHAWWCEQIVLNRIYGFSGNP